MQLTAYVSFLRVSNIVDETTYEPSAIAVRKLGIEVSLPEYDHHHTGDTTNLLELVKRAFCRFRAEQYPEDKDELYRLDVAFCGLKWETTTNQQLILREESLSKFDATANAEYFLYYRETKVKRNKRRSLPGKSGSGSSMTRQKRMISVKNQNFSCLFVANIVSKLRELLMHPSTNPMGEHPERLLQLYTNLCRRFLKHIRDRDASFSRLAAAQKELCRFLNRNQGDHGREIGAVKEWIVRNFEELCSISTTAKWIDIQSVDPETHARTHELHYFDDAVEFDRFITRNYHQLSVDDGLRNVAMHTQVDSNIIIIGQHVYEACLEERIRPNSDGKESEPEEKQREQQRLQCAPKFCTDEFHMLHPIGEGDYSCIVSGGTYSYLSMQKLQLDFESAKTHRAKKRHSAFGVRRVSNLIGKSRHSSTGSNGFHRHSHGRQENENERRFSSSSVTSLQEKKRESSSKGRSGTRSLRRSTSVHETDSCRPSKNGQTPPGRGRRSRTLRRVKTSGFVIDDVVPDYKPTPSLDDLGDLEPIFRTPRLSSGDAKDCLDVSKDNEKVVSRMTSSDVPLSSDCSSAEDVPFSSPRNLIDDRKGNFEDILVASVNSEEKRVVPEKSSSECVIEEAPISEKKGFLGFMKGIGLKLRKSRVQQ